MKTITPNWPAPKNVRALTTTRAGGVSIGAYASFNLGDHVGDDPAAVRANRATLRNTLKLQNEPLWLKQVHGTHIVNAATAQAGAIADGAWTNERGVVLAIMTADCLPIFLSDRKGTTIALVHAGWRGLAAGVIDAGVQSLRVPAADLVAHLGPGIGPDAYEVGADVRSVFLGEDPQTHAAFRAAGEGKWFADMYRLARMRLHALGVRDISGGDRCTSREREEFYSYRRDGVTGRMASLLWIE
jgi:polyphenol oxidase